jgi:hypothetical protein
VTDLKLTPKMLARVLYEAHAEDVAEKTAAMTEAEKDAALAKMGTSRAGLKASLAARRATYEAEARKKEPSRVAPLSSWRTRILPWAAILSGAFASGSFATSLAVYQRVSSLPLATFAAPPIGTGAAAEDRARQLRYEALRMLALGNYAQCISNLDEARTLDPQGEGDAALASARRRAEQGLADQKRSP